MHVFGQKEAASPGNGCAHDDRVKDAKAVAACCEGEISPLAPASILRTHPNTTIYLDQRSAALLSAAVPVVVQR